MRGIFAKDEEGFLCLKNNFSEEGTKSCWPVPKITIFMQERKLSSVGKCGGKLGGRPILKRWEKIIMGFFFSGFLSTEALVGVT